MLSERYACNIQYRDRYIGVVVNIYAWMDVCCFRYACNVCEVVRVTGAMKSSFNHLSSCSSASSLATGMDPTANLFKVRSKPGSRAKAPGFHKTPTRGNMGS